MSYYFRAILNNGVSLSIQADCGAYCNPRKDDATSYTEVEVLFPSEEIELISKYKEFDESCDKSVYRYVPVEVVRQVIRSAGGLKTLSPLPPGILDRAMYVDIYRRCSSAISSSHKEEWLKKKSELLNSGKFISMHEWCVLIYQFMESKIGL